jgi:hypothetical protein
MQVEAWRETLGLKRRLELNHPNTVLRRWKAETLPPQGDAEPKDRKTGMRDLFTAVDRVNDVADRIEHKTGGAEIFGQDDTRRFIAALQAIVAPTAPPGPPTDAAFVKSLGQPRSRARSQCR